MKLMSWGSIDFIFLRFFEKKNGVHNIIFTFFLIKKSFLNFKGPQIVKLYESTGKFKEVQELKEKLQTALVLKEF